MDNQGSLERNQPVVANPHVVTANPQPRQEVVKIVNRGLSGGRVAALLIVSVVLSVLIGAGSMLLVFHFFPNLTKDNVTNVTRVEKEVSITDQGIADAVDKVYDSVVIVKTYRRNQLYATGTGFVYKKINNMYYLLTNYHVIQDGDKVEVVFTDNTTKTVTVKGGDKYSDVAVLAYQEDASRPIAKIGSSIDMRVGDTVFAIGSPLDSSVYSWSVTRGVLSGKDRKVEVSTSNSSVNDWIMQVLQTDAAINSGNSGGPLCNSNGEVIGINNMKLITSGVEGMGFAIPIEEASAYADAIINGKNITKPTLGITMTDNAGGVLITDVLANSVAATAGLQRGDIIVAINDDKVVNVASLKYALYKYEVGDTVTIKYLRNGKTQTTKLKLTQ
jgi:serine protease Do